MAIAIGDSVQDPSFSDVGSKEEVVTIAAFRSGETQRLARLLGFDVAVIMVSDDPAATADYLSRTWHGAFSPRADWVLPFDTYDAMPWTVRFEPFPMDPRWMGPSPLPSGITVEDGSLKVALAPGAATDDFAPAFMAAMEDLAFERIAARPGRVDYRFRTGRPLVIGSRYSAPRRGRYLPPLATGIYAFRPKGLKWLVQRALQARAVADVRAALRSGSGTQFGMDRDSD